MFDNIEQCCQLHERVEIHYYVDHYEAQLWTGNGEGRKVVVGNGESIEDAMKNLDEQCNFLTLAQVRKLPEVR